MFPTAGAAFAQVTAPERVLSERLCAECTITMDAILSIPRGEVSDQLFLAVGPDGTVVGVDPVLHPGRVLRFDPDGLGAAHADVGRLVTPGAPFFSPDGEILVPDERYGMVQILTPSLKPVRTFMTVDYPRVGIVLPGGTVVINALSRTAERARYALHLLNPGDGRVTSMDRSDIRLLSQSNGYELERYPAPRDSASFWSLHGTTYRIDLWDVSGRLIESLRREASWFEKRTSLTPAYIAPPPTDLRGLTADSDGLLWVLASVADPEWAGYEIPAADGRHAEGGPHPGWNRHLEDGVFDTILEVVDPESGTVIARERYDEYFFGFAGSGVVVHYDGSSNDAGSYSILRVALRRAGALTGQESAALAVAEGRLQ